MKLVAISVEVELDFEDGLTYAYFGLSGHGYVTFCVNDWDPNAIYIEKDDQVYGLTTSADGFSDVRLHRDRLRWVMSDQIAGAIGAEREMDISFSIPVEDYEELKRVVHRIFPDVVESGTGEGDS